MTQPTANKDTPNGCAVIIAILVILAIIGSFVGDDDEDGGSGGGGGSSASLDEVTAYDACKGSVKNQLRAPGTASFPNYYKHNGEVSISGSGSTLTISSHVDAENGFGGEVRTQWVCTATESGDSWRGLATLLG